MTEPTLRMALAAVAASRFSTRAGESELGPTFDNNDEFVAGLARERLTGVALEAVQRGTLSLRPAPLEALTTRHEAQLELDLRLERLLVEAAEHLAAEGIAYRALKGPLLAHTVYPDPALRSFGDIDILVPGTAFDTAIAALRPLGFERRFAEPRAGFDARFSKGACLERADGLEIDLHRTLAPGAFGVRLSHADLFGRRPRSFVVGGRTITGLDRELAFVHACFHSALGDHPARLVPLCDVAEIAAAGFDHEAVIALASSVRCESVFQRAIELVDVVLGVRIEGPLGDWSRAYRPSRFDDWALRGYATDERSYAGQVAASMWAMRSMRERIAYAGALAFPARDYLLARERGYTQRWARGAHLARQARPRTGPGPLREVT